MNHKIFTLLSCLLCSWFLLLESAQDDSLVVLLDTEAPLLPIYVAPWVEEGSAFNQEYLSSLKKVLEFDLNHTGMTQIIGNQSKLLANGAKFDQGLNSAEWNSLGAYYAIKLLIKGKKLSVRVLAANTDTIKKLDDIELQGSLSSDRRQIHQIADHIFKALFGSDGIATTKILYTVKSAAAEKWNSEVWEADYDGGNPRQLTKSSGGYAVTPVYMPAKPGYGSGGFFYVTYRGGQPKISYQSFHEGQSKRLTSLKGNQLMPAISPKRDKLAFISDVTGNPDLFILPFNPDEGTVGKPYQIFSTRQGTQGTPTFSPDGKQIAFVSNKDGSPRIYKMKVPEAGASIKNLQAVLLTKLSRESSAPAWSPDGKKIAYCALTNGVRQIWIYDLEKNRERQLTRGPGNKENPTWAPNSLHIMFNSSDKKACELYFINLNQTEATKITTGPGEKRFPNWEVRMKPG